MMHENRKCETVHNKKIHAPHKNIPTLSHLSMTINYLKKNHDIIWKNILKYTCFQTTPIQSPCLYSESDILSPFFPSMEETNMLINIPALGHAGTRTRQTVWV